MKGLVWRLRRKLAKKLDPSGRVDLNTYRRWWWEAHQDYWRMRDRAETLRDLLDEAFGKDLKWHQTGVNVMAAHTDCFVCNHEHTLTRLLRRDVDEVSV